MNFAEKIINSIVDENGYCGGRGLSERQFDCLTPSLEEGKCESCGGWSGDKGGHIDFWYREYEGQIGRFHVVLSERHHFKIGYGIVEISPIWTEEEWEARLSEKEAEKEALRASSKWVGEVKERLEFDCKVVKVGEFNGRYGSGLRYEFLDGDGNLFVWFTSCRLEVEEGQELRIRATIKKHSEYDGVKQNIVNRVNVR